MLQVELAQTKGLIIIVTPDSRNSPLGLEMKWESQLSTRHTGESALSLFLVHQHLRIDMSLIQIR